MTPEVVTFDEVRMARLVVDRLAREELLREDMDLYAGLVEAKRMLGIASNVRWPERWDELDAD